MAEINLTELGSVQLSAAPSERPRRAGEVLVVGLDDWAIGEAATLLAAAGRTVHRCSDSADAPFPCNALVAGRGCPLDRRHVDVVLNLHSRPRPQLQPSEMGVICGLRAGLPLVIGGISDASILAPWAEQVPPGGDIVSTCDAAVEKKAALPAPEQLNPAAPDA